MKKDKFSHISDDELLQRFLKNKENEWLGILLQRYTLLLLGVCMKYLKDEEEARDTVQQIFLKVLQDVQKYKIENFKPWLYMVARNTCLTILRDKKKLYHEEISDKNNFYNDFTIGDEFNNAQNDIPIELLEVALKELNTEQKQCITLFYLQKNSYQEVSDATGYSLLQVKSFIQNGKRNLKISIEKKLKQSQNNV
ncbi:MAG TPA: sigma-70 family RNA polymerase sigma factor [Niabella sp.]|nr:sigma-70 family RNA polymerase sigma factor [Chitinophagaceae bacterium]HRN46742.1 sigma-70 family RNA polymerase sigma factor [Niabella sp.]HRO84047.1 sigma-70 family RNA polymerase sigma factor [Niabella sp.]HUN03025.1 sigma-70 family RNA polymerase sigma factor [Niabella sp.]